MTTKVEEKVPTTKELVALILPEIHVALNERSRDYLRRMMEGELLSERDFTTAIIAADGVLSLEEYLRSKR